MTELIFATRNEHKAEEIRAIIKGQIKLLTLNETDITEEIEEPFETLEENAKAKSDFVYQKTGKNCFSEDTGLEVKALNNEPGVRTARYAGPGKNDDDNIEKLLKNMTGILDRRARFRTIISYIDKGINYQFEGICEGLILPQREGENGFGYDPVFRPIGSPHSFAMMQMEEKNTFSHRMKALTLFLDFLKTRSLL